VPLQIAGLIHLELLTDFFNKIGQDLPHALQQSNLFSIVTR
jgi:hypothetical protein